MSESTLKYRAKMVAVNKMVVSYEQQCASVSSLQKDILVRSTDLRLLTDISYMCTSEEHIAQRLQDIEMMGRSIRERPEGFSELRKMIGAYRGKCDHSTDPNEVVFVRAFDLKIIISMVRAEINHHG